MKEVFEETSEITDGRFNVFYDVEFDGGFAYTKNKTAITLTKYTPTVERILNKIL